MSPRRSFVAAVVLTTSTLITGFASTANASSGPCSQPSPVCSVYDTAKGETAVVLAQVVADCYATFASEPCPTVATVGGLVYWFVFYPYAACATVNGQTTCIGPIELGGRP